MNTTSNTTPNTTSNTTPNTTSKSVSKAPAKTVEMSDKVISLLSEVNRKGIDNLIQFVKNSNYLTTAQCYSHHTHPEGLMMHSLEVLDYMLKNNHSGLSRESIILVALCHDLGKARVNGMKIGRGEHPARSVYILKQCGVELTEDERDAIRCHHPKGIADFLSRAFSSPLQLLLQMGDSRSTHINKRGGKYRFSAL